MDRIKTQQPLTLYRYLNAVDEGEHAHAILNGAKLYVTTEDISGLDNVEIVGSAVVNIQVTEHFESVVLRGVPKRASRIRLVVNNTERGDFLCSGS